MEHNQLFAGHFYQAVLQINYGSGSSKYGSIVKTASIEYGRLLVGTVLLFI